MVWCIVKLLKLPFGSEGRIIPFWCFFQELTTERNQLNDQLQHASRENSALKEQLERVSHELAVTKELYEQVQSKSELTVYDINPYVSK